MVATAANHEGLTSSATSVPTAQVTEPSVDLTTAKDTIDAAHGYSHVQINGMATTLSSGDIINPGGTGNVLALTGGGTFSLAKPKTLTNIQVVKAVEGAGLPTITLRKGVNVTLILATGAGSSGAKVTGAADSSTIILGDGTDTVTLGSPTETVFGGAGADTFNVTGATIGATIDGGSGPSRLNVNGGGPATMGGNITGIETVFLVKPTNFTANDLDLTITGSTGADTITAGGGTETIIGHGGADLLIGGAGADTFKDTTTNLAKVTIQGFDATDTIDLTNLKPSAKTATTVGWSAATEMLTVTQGTKVTSIHLTGDFSPEGFSTGSDGANGTAIKYVPPPTAPAPAGLSDHAVLSAPVSRLSHWMAAMGATPVAGRSTLASRVMEPHWMLATPTP